MNKKVYIITYRDEYSNGEIYSGVSYVFDTLKKAENMLKTIKKDEIKEHKDNGEDIRNNIEIKDKELIIDLGDDYTIFSIVEMEIR